MLKLAGSPTLAGTLNLNGTIDVLVTKLVHENSLAQITTLVAQAQASKSRFQEFADRVSACILPIAGVAAVRPSQLDPFRRPIIDVRYFFSRPDYLVRRLDSRQPLCPKVVCFCFGRQSSRVRSVRHDRQLPVRHRTRCSSLLGRRISLLLCDTDTALRLSRFLWSSPQPCA